MENKCHGDTDEAVNQHAPVEVWQQRKGHGVSAAI